MESGLEGAVYLAPRTDLTSAENEIVDLIHDRCKARDLSLAMPAGSLVQVTTATGGAISG